MSASIELWLPVVGFEGKYQVSDHGRVRSVSRVERIATGLRRYQGRLLRPGTVESGHQLVVLGRGNSRLVHALVLTAFVGPRPPGADSLHSDGNPANNMLANLRWGTRSENVRDSQRHGTFVVSVGPGELCPRAILTAEQVRHIREIGGAEPQGQIAARYGVSRSTIGKLLTGKTWTSVEQGKFA